MLSIWTYRNCKKKILTSSNNMYSYQSIAFIYSVPYSHYTSLLVSTLIEITTKPQHLFWLKASNFLVNHNLGISNLIGLYSAATVNLIALSPLSTNIWVSKNMIKNMINKTHEKTLEIRTSAYFLQICTNSGYMSVKWQHRTI